MAHHSARFSFLRFFGGGNNHFAKDGGNNNNNNDSLREDDSHLRRTRSLCDGRASVMIGGLTSNHSQHYYKGFHAALPLTANQSQRFYNTRIKRKVPATATNNSMTNSMDLPLPVLNATTQQSSKSAFSTLVPLPVEVVQLCESAFGKLFHPYEAVRWTLLEQIRKVFYADCAGDVQQLCHGFLAPAANLLDTLRKGSKLSSNGNCAHQHERSSSSSPSPAANAGNCSWPLCLDGRIIIHLTELDRSHFPGSNGGKLERGHFYFHLSRPCRSNSGPSNGLQLCLKLRTLAGECLEVRIPASKLAAASSSNHGMAFSQKWFEETIFRSGDTRLLSALQFCVVSFERSIERLELQLLASGVRSASSSGGQRLQPDGALSGHLLPTKDNELLSSGAAAAAAAAGAAGAAGSSSDDCSACQCLCGIINSSESTTAEDGSLMNAPSSSSSSLSSSSSQYFRPNASDVTSTGERHQPESSHNSLPGRGNLITELHSELILSGGMIFPGVVDRLQHPVVFVFAQRFPAAVTSGDVADLLVYFHSVARETTSKNGFTLVVDISSPDPGAIVEPTKQLEPFLTKLDAAIHLFEERISSGFHRVLVIVQSETPAPIETADRIRDSFIKTSSGKIIFVHGKDDLRMQIDDMNILTDLDGRLSFHHRKFVSYRTEIEPFIETCRSASRRLLEAIQELKLQDRCACQCKAGSNGASINGGPASSVSHPITAAHYSVMIQAQKQMTQLIFEDGNLRKLQQDGEGMLQRFQEEQSCREAKDSYDQAAQIYNEVHTATVKLAKLAAKRQAKLERCYQIKRLDEESRKVLSWLRKKGEETLQRYSLVGENLAEVRQQQQELEKFYFVATKQLENAADILEEFHSLDQSDCPPGIGELHRCLREHHKRFSDRLEEARDRTDDAARCYCLVERSFEWTLSTINFISQFRLEANAPLELLNIQLRRMEGYMAEHPALPKESFAEMDRIAARLRSPRLTEKCVMARLRCQEAESLSVAKETAFLKAKFALLPADGSSLSEQLSSRSISRRDSGITCETIRDCNLHRSSTFRQASIPEMDETSSCSDTPYIDADSTNGTDSVPLGSACSSSSATTTESERICSDTVSCGGPPGTTAERRLRGNMRRSQTWQGAEGPQNRSESRGRSETNGECFEDDDFAEADLARLSRRESWTIPTSNSHLSICHSADAASYGGFRSVPEHGNSASMTLQELIQTEIDYILALKFVIDNYLPDVSKDSVPQILRGKGNVVFGNITKIYDFHKNDFLQAVRHCESSPFHLGQVFQKFERQFYLYALYTHNKPKSDELMAECGNSYFKARQSKLQDKMDLSSYLLKPVQRMVKYAGLLKQLLKLCPRTDPEWERLQAAEEMVKFQLRHGNDLLAMDLLRDCDVNIKEQGRLCRQDDMEVWVAGKKRSRRVFLFEEIILFSKVKKDRHGCETYQYKNSIKTTEVGLTEQLGDSQTRFEIWFRKRKLGDNYILQASSAEEKQSWTRDVSAILWSQAIKGREARLLEMNSMGIEKKTCLDIKPSEDQINHRYVNLRQQGCSSSARGSVESLRSGRHQRPHSTISVSSSTMGGGSTLISSPVQAQQQKQQQWSPDSTSVPEDANESPRRSHCSSESGIGLDTTNSSSPVDSDSSK